MRRYNIINNSLGWLCFIIAAVTYLLTLEPTASFWDCPEFISQGYKLEIGHPPGNPIFMLAARFFINFTGGDVSNVAIAVNAMSGLLSAATILLLFWSITHLMRRLIVDDDATTVTPLQMILIFGSGLCGALMYAWSDTFWFSAVEGEVYAFSSFCTALVFWLILKWENRAESPVSDRYLLLIAYVIGVSIAVHLLNLLCIPAIVLVVYYRLWKKPNLKGSLMALLISFAIVGLILFGLVPGFVEVASWFELLAVNIVGMSYNMGVLIYAILLVAVFIWATIALYRNSAPDDAPDADAPRRVPISVKIPFILAVLLSGMLFIGNFLIGLLLSVGFIIFILVYKKLPMRVLSLVLLSMFVIFIGYSSYALLLIRSDANPPMNQNSPDNVFALSSYLSREQYGETPLLYGRTPASLPLYDPSGRPYSDTIKAIYSKVVKTDPSQPDRYLVSDFSTTSPTTPELNLLFPRIYSPDPSHQQGYKGWVGLSPDQPLGEMGEGTIIEDANGNALRTEYMPKPTFAQNISYFLNYQLNHMYWRYFMWNFAGRQNDIQGDGEVNHGNWITGIPFIDNARLGDQSLLPYLDGEGNKGHNVFYALPLLMGIIGLLWQAFTSKRGIEQFWVVFFLFFMTGIAIVLYLNQPPGQPRERDYAFAGSFYAFAIWVGYGVTGLYNIIVSLTKGVKNTRVRDYAAAGFAALVGILVPIQVVSQTWDDHDRSGRYACRDFGMNYLNSLDENAIIFTMGDNDTFPLWYAQEVEGVRTDVKVVNLSYLSTDWYVNQIKHPSYDAPLIKTIATPSDYAYKNISANFINFSDTTWHNAADALRTLYASSPDPRYGVRTFPATAIYFPVDVKSAIANGIISPAEEIVALDTIYVDMQTNRKFSGSGTFYLNDAMTYDILASSLADGWNRPIYFAGTVPVDSYDGLHPYLRSTGLAYEVTPLIFGENSYWDIASVNTDKAYRNITERFRWGGLDSGDDIYLDETVRRMVNFHRTQMLGLASALYNEGYDALVQAGDIPVAEGQVLPATSASPEQLRAYAKDRFDKAVVIITMMDEKLPRRLSPMMAGMVSEVADLSALLAKRTGNETLRQNALKALERELEIYTGNILYYQSLKPSQYSTLQGEDLRIDRLYYLPMVQAYFTLGGNQQGLEAIPGIERVDFNRLQRNYQ